MALAEMCKGRIAVHKSVADELVGKLQALGCCEFIEQPGTPLDSGALNSLRSKQRHIEELLTDTRFLLRLLEPFEKNKENSLSRMLGDIPVITFSELAAKVDEEKFKAFVVKLREKERKMTERRADISRIKALLAQITLLESIKYPLEFFTTGTDVIGGAVYSVPNNTASEVPLHLAEELGDFIEYQELPGGERDMSVIFAILFRKEDQDKVQNIFSGLSASRVDIPKDFELTAEEEKIRLTVSLEMAEKEETALCTEIASYADEGLDMARYYGDYWTIIHDRLSSMISGMPTEEVFIWSFWMPKEYLKLVEYTIRQYESLIEFTLTEADEGESIPTLLKNPAWSSSIEPLTLMYGTPTYGGVDPTSLMAPFFFLFLGMCFGDAGYGLLLSGIFGYFLVKHRLSPTLRKFFIMLAIGMGCSVIIGALTGSWFGDSITAYPFLSSLVPLKDAVQLLDPMNDPMTMLMISLGLGFTQVIFGLLIAFKSNWSQGERFAALADQGGWIVFLFGLLLTGLGMSGVINGVLAGISKYIAILGALILVMTQGRGKTGIVGKLFSGVLSLYNVTGYLGDVLSYSRLLALGLSSAAIGMVINLLAKLVVGTPYIGILLAVLIFVAGHTFSIAVNLLGAFIHSLRLQYVEFFGKFYDANGKDFTPLCNATQFARLTEDPAVH
ncbi:MAG: V-type ATP synthase subunit I [Synergistaceae bacterium]|nr:V-type ATP synthase subunit I [Synergistaceae bacterium]